MSKLDVEKFMCSFRNESNSNDEHLVEEPIEMECSRYMCQECLINNLQDQSINCNCGLTHTHIDLNELVVKEAVKDLMKKETKALYDWLYESILKTENDLNDENDEALIDYKINELKKMVRERVQKLKDDLDRIEAQLLNEIDEIKREVESELKPIDYENIKQKLIDNLKDLDDKDLNAFYERQENYLKICEEFNKANEFNNRLIDNITLTISEKQLDKSWIGTLLV